MRVDKFLSNMGCGSRKDIKHFVKIGAVSVNGKPCKDSGQNVDENSDIVTLFGETVVYKEFAYLMMNKPQGVISATEDFRGATVATELVGEDFNFYDLSPAGRLDIDTEGFLLLTNDGKFIHDIITPSRHVDKVYYCEADGEIEELDFTAFEKGLTLADGFKCMPAKLEKIESGNGRCKARVTICEGKFHQVKRMFLARGKEITYLKRISIGGVALDESLAPGEYRELTAEELNILKKEND